MTFLFKEFKEICLELNEIGIIPTLMGSLGLEFISKVNWQPSDIDIHVPGDPRGWEAPDELRIDNWNNIIFVMKKTRYELVDIHEHEFQKNGIHVEYGTIDSLNEFAGISESDIALIQLDDIQFRVPNIKQFLTIYEASSKDSYRNNNNNHKDFPKIEWLQRQLTEK